MQGHRALIVCLCGALWSGSAGPAWCQNDWQFPDPYFGAVEFDISRPPAARRVEARSTDVRPTPPARPRAMRPGNRFRARWTSAGQRRP